MKWSWNVGRYFGIPVAIHATFLIIIAWVMLLHWIDGDTLRDMLIGVGFVLAIFVCVLLHEFGHSLMARKFGIETKDITLLPIGGLSRIEKIPEKPFQEFLVTAAGPAVNVVIAIGLFLWLWFTSSVEPLKELSVTTGPFLERLMLVNIFLVLFNILPAFPMDGGRLVRALLATKLEYTKATQVAATLGQGMALLFGFIGFFINPFLIFIAFFVWIGAEQEASMVQMKTVLGDTKVDQAMITDFKTLSIHDTLAEAADLILSGSQHDFPVMENDQLVGILTRSDLMVTLAKQGKEFPIQEVMQKEFHTVEPTTTLEQAFTELKECQCQTVPVISNGQLVGLVTMDNVGEFVMIQSALKGLQADKALNTNPSFVAQKQFQKS